MKAQSLPDEKLGKAILRIVMDGPFYRGAVIRDGKRGEVFEDQDLEHLRHRLREEAGRSDPDYWGFEEAISRFRSFNATGFSDQTYLSKERAYKVSASEWLLECLPLDRAFEASASEAVNLAKVVGKTNLLAHQHEQQHLREVLTGSQGADFVKASADIARGDIDVGLRRIASLERAVGKVSWPMATYLPFLWDRDRHMFLKPEVTRDFARRVGHAFADAYDSELNPKVYRSLLDLTETTAREIAPLNPRDHIDVQSFIWVVGKYTDEERRSAEKFVWQPGEVKLRDGSST